jgi:hypothetical protein
MMFKAILKNFLPWKNLEKQPNVHRFLFLGGIINCLSFKVATYYSPMAITLITHFNRTRQADTMTTTY